MICMPNKKNEVEYKADFYHFSKKKLNFILAASRVQLEQVGVYQYDLGSEWAF